MYNSVLMKDGRTDSMRDEEILRTYESLKKEADRALEDAQERERRYGLIEDIVGFVFTVAVAFVWMMLVLILISFVGLAYFHFQFTQMLVWSTIFAAVIGVVAIFDIVMKRKR